MRDYTAIIMVCQKRPWFRLVHIEALNKSDACSVARAKIFEEYKTTMALHASTRIQCLKIFDGWIDPSKI